MITTVKYRALSQLTDPWRVQTSSYIGNRIAYVVVRGVGERTVLMENPSEGWFIVNRWRWNDAKRQFSAAHQLCAQMNDILLENLPVEGLPAAESLLADIGQSEEFAKMALAARDTSAFHAHTAYAALCRRRLSKAQRGQHQ